MWETGKFYHGGVGLIKDIWFYIVEFTERLGWELGVGRIQYGKKDFFLGLLGMYVHMFDKQPPVFFKFGLSLSLSPRQNPHRTIWRIAAHVDGLGGYDVAEPLAGKQEKDAFGGEKERRSDKP